MARPFRKLWKYLMAAFSSKIDQHADPKIQIQQAIEAEQIQHQKLSQQAASVIGNQRQLEMQMARQTENLEKLRRSVQQALVLIDDANAKSDVEKARGLEKTAETLAAQLLTAESELEASKTLHAQAVQASAQATQAVERNGQRLQQLIAEKSKLFSQIEQARMQEQVAASMQSLSELAAPGDTPTLAGVRDKIEERYAKALGAAQLAGDSVQARMLEVQASTVDAAAQDRLAQMRAAMRGETAGNEVTAGEARPQLHAVEQPKPNPETA